MSNDYLFHTGEATVLARDGQFTDAMPEILIGRTSGPVARLFRPHDYGGVLEQPRALL